MADKSSYMWNVERHFSEMLSLPIEFLHESLIWDAGHRLELVHDDVENDNCKCRACPYPCPHLHIKALTRPGAAAIAPGICLLGHILHGRGGHISQSVHMHISQCRRIRAS